jgi:hypothetical protein
MLGFWAFCLGTWYLLNLSIFATGHVLPAVVLLGENHWFAPARNSVFLVWSVRFSQHRTITSMERMSCSGLEFTREELSVLSSFGKKIMSANGKKQGKNRCFNYLVPRNIRCCFYCCPPCPRVCWSFIWKESCPFAPQRSWKIELTSKNKVCA